MTPAGAKLPKARGTITLGIDDIEAALRESPERRRASWVLIGFGMGLTVVFGALRLQGRETGALQSALLPMAVSLIGFAVGYRLFGARVMATLRYGALPPYERVLTFEIDETGLTIESRDWRRRIERERIDRAFEGTKTFFVYTGPFSALSVPKRAFALSDTPHVSSWFESLPKRSRPNIALWIIAAGAVMWLVLIAMWLVIRWTLGP